MRTFAVASLIGWLWIAALLGVRPTAAAAAAGAPDPPAVPPPTIVVSPDVYYPLDEVLYLEGTTRADTVVQIQFQKTGAKPVFYTVKSDPRGEWVLAAKVPLEPGSWETRARVAAGQFSDWSNPRVFRVIQTGVSVGGLTVTFAALSSIIIAFAILGAAAIWFFAARMRTMKHALVSRELLEAENSMRAGASELRQDLLEELRALEAGDRRLSPEEISRRERILRELDHMEKAVEKEIQDIKEKL